MSEQEQEPDDTSANEDNKAQDDAASLDHFDDLGADFGPSGSADNDQKAEPLGVHDFDNSINYIEVGEPVDLLKKDPTLRHILVGAGWDQKAFEEKPLDMDVSCFLLNHEDMTREDGDFIFYNSMTGCNGAVKHLDDNRTGAGDGDDENITLALQDIPFDVMKIVLVLSCYDPEFEGYHMGMARNVYIRLVNSEDGHELLRYEVKEETLDNQNCVIAMTITRDGPKWIVDACDEAVQGGLAAIAQRYGIMVAEQTG